MFVENVVQGVARDLLAAAIDRFEQRGITVTFHCHDEVTIETPIGALSDEDFRAILLELPAWAAGMPLGGKVHAGAHYLPPPEREAEPSGRRPIRDEQAVEAAIDDILDEARRDPGEIDDPALVDREDDEDFVANLPDAIAPLLEMVTLPLTADNKVCCPFHDEVEPSCAIYADHWHCFGCGQHGGRLDWLERAEGMTEGRGDRPYQGLAGTASTTTRTAMRADKLAFAMSIWTAAEPPERTRRALSRRDSPRRPQPTAGRYSPRLALSSGLRVRPRRRSAVLDRVDARSAHRHAPSASSASPSRSATARSGRSSGACWARPASSSCGRPAKRWSSAKGSRPCSPRRPAFPTAASRSFRPGRRCPPSA